MWSSLHTTCWPSLNNLPSQKNVLELEVIHKSQNLKKPRSRRFQSWRSSKKKRSPLREEWIPENKAKMQVLLERARLPTWKSLQLVAWSKGWAPTMLELWKPWAHGSSLHSSKRTRWCISNEAQDPEGRGGGFIIYKLKVKEDEGSTEGPSMKELLEQANTMLKSLTTTAASSTATGSATGSREDVMDWLQSQLDQLKLRLKVFEINQISYGSLQGLVDSGSTHSLRPRRLEKEMKPISVCLSHWPMERRLHCKWHLAASWWLKEPMSNQYSLWDNLSMTLVAKFAGTMVTWRSFIHAEVYYQCKTKKDVLNYHELLPWIWSRKWRWWEVRDRWEVWSSRKSRSGWRNWSKVTLFSGNFQNESKTGFWSMWAIGKICQSIAAKENVFSVMAVWCIYTLEKMRDSLCPELWSSKGETPINYSKMTWNVGSPTICWMMLECTLVSFALSCMTR